MRDKWEDISKQLVAVSITTTITVISVSHIWDFILAIPFLQPILGITSAVSLVLVQIILVWWLAGWALHHHRIRDHAHKNLKRLPPGSSGQ